MAVPPMHRHRPATMISLYTSPAQTLTSSKITNYPYIFRGGFERRALHTTHCAAQPVLQSHARHQ